MLLTVDFHQGQGKGEPPNSVYEKGDRHAHGILYKVTEKHHDEGNQEGNTAADVPPGIAVGRDLVQPFFRGDVGQHRIVKHQRGGKPHFGDAVDEQEGNPEHGHGEETAADDSQQGESEKQRAFAAEIRVSAENWRDDGGDDGHDRRRVAPVRRRKRGTDAGFVGERTEIDGQNGGRQQDEGGITYIIENPPQFCRRKALFSRFAFH